MTVEETLSALGITLPEPVAPLASYIPAVQTGNLVYISGQVPMADGRLVYSGAVPSDVSPEDAKEAARICAINCMAALKALIGDLERVVRIVKATGYVNSDPKFGGAPGIINGASDLLGEVFGDRGKHARAAVGVSALPLNATVEVELIVEVSP